MKILTGTFLTMILMMNSLNQEMTMTGKKYL